MIAKKIQAFGQVQGVFYRASTKTKTDELGLFGWVQNQPDGSVLIEVQGDKSPVMEFVKWCRNGPQFANVSSLAVEEIEPKGFLSFEIIH